MNVDPNAIWQVFELEKTAVNSTILAQQISTNLQVRSLKLPTDWPSFALTIDIPPTPSAAHHLRTAIAEAVKAYDQIWLELAIPASDNSLMARLKRPFHQLALFYVNRLGQKQIVFNDRLLRAVNSLANLDEEKSREIQVLRAQVAELQQRIQGLEQP